MKLKLLYDERKVFFVYNEILGGKPEALNVIFSVRFLGTTKPLFKREVGGKGSGRCRHRGKVIQTTAKPKPNSVVRPSDVA